jgi:hypothetical protein
MLEADPEAYVNFDPSWKPTLPAAQDARFGLADLLATSTSTTGVA